MKDFLQPEQSSEIFENVQNNPMGGEIDKNLKEFLNEIRDTEKPVMARKPFRHTDGRSHNREWPRGK